MIVAAASAFSACSGNDAGTAQEHLQRGKAFLANQQYNEASIEFRNAVRYDGKSGEARLLLAEAFLGAGDRARATTEFIRAADLLPDSSDAQIKAGHALLVVQRFEDAEARADRVLGREPQNAQALVLKGYALAGLQRIDDAVKQLEEAISLDAGTGARTSLGMLQLRQGQADAAEATFKQAIAAAPQSVQAHLALGQFYWMTNRRDEAERAWLRAVEVQPKDPLANRTLAAFYLSVQRPLEAEKFLKTAVDNSKDPAAALALADYYVALGRQKDALAVLQPSVSAEGAVGIGATLRTAEIDYAAGEKEKAQKAIDAVITQHPKVSAAHILKSRLLLAEGKPKEALERAQHALTLDANAAAAHYASGLAHLALNNAIDAAAAFTEVLRLNPRAADAQTRLAALHLAAGKSSAAVSMAQAATRADGQNRDARLLLVQSLLANGDNNGADSAAKQLLAMESGWGPAHRVQGEVHLKAGNFPAAEQAFRRALQLQADDTQAVQGLVTVLVGTKRATEGRQLLEAQVAKYPKDAAAIVLIAELDVAERDLAAAERNYMRAIEADGDHFNAYFRLGRLYAFQKRLSEATAKFEEITRRQPRNVPAQTMVALLLQMQNRTDDARHRYHQVLEIDSRAAVAANNLAWLYAEEETNLDLALQLAQTAKQEQPNVPGISDTLGWVYYKRNLTSQAIEAFADAVKRDPRNAAYRYHLGLAYVRAGEVGKGRDSLNEALKLPGFTEAAEARKVLASLQG